MSGAWSRPPPGSGARAVLGEEVGYAAEVPGRPPPLVALAVAVGGALAVACLGDPRAHATAFVAVVVAWGAVVATLAPDAPGPARVVLAALLVRLPLLVVAPTLSDDVWRYVWEGQVWRAGENPFVLAPDAPALAHLRDTVWANVNHRQVPSIYPPFAQLLFLVLAGGGVLAWRLVSAACDVGTAWVLARARPRAGWLWALLPLPALESAVSGHLEGIGVLFLVLAIVTPEARGRGAWAWMGAMVKLLPGVLLVLERPRAWLGWALLTLLVALPLVRAEGFETYRASWAFNGSLFPLAELGLGTWTRPLLQALGLAVVAGVLLRSRDPARVALWTTGAFVLLSPTVHPWYVLWPLAAALLNGSRAWVVLAVTVPASYIVLSTYDPATSAWTEWATTRIVVYAPFYGALIAEGWGRLVRAGPATAR
ncbi:MAG: hypothetical protein Q8P18_24785 [Pseudomonadota bacterium]|nr:hypothetical protein [Pseudomonadota bacterium]